MPNSRDEHDLPGGAPPTPIDSAVKLLHELQVYQVELAQQNEELQTSRADAEASLRRYVDLYQAVPVGLVTVDRRGGVLEINHRGLDLLGGHGHCGVGRSVLDCVAEESRAALNAMLMDTDPPLGSRGTEIRVSSSAVSGRVLHAEMRVNPSGDDTLLLALTDVTARSRVKAELARTRDILELSNRVARIGHWELNLETRALTWSAMTKEIHGVPADYQPTVESALAFYPAGGSRERITAAVAAAEQDGRNYDLELVSLTAQGRRLWVRVIGLVDQIDGRTRRLYGTMQDIDARVQAETDRLAQAKAEAANRSKSEFLARMSHDLRTPLNAVLGFSSLLALDPSVRSSPKASEHVQHIRGAGEHLLAMVDDMLDLSRIETGHLRLSIEPIAAGPLVAECVTLTSPLAEELDVDVRLEQQGSWLLGDRTRLRQVLINLLSNAIKYNRQGGSVELALFVDRRGRGDRVAISVTDTGRGMTPAQLADLFQPFNRLGAEQGEVEGVGLGLVIARQLVVAMNGTLDVESTPGRGSVFTVRLPRADEPAASAQEMTTAVTDARSAASAGPTPAPASTRPFTVLYIEDNPVNQTLMSFVIAERKGVKLELAADGLAGVEAAHALHPDLVLLDLNLPRLDGYGVLARLHADPALAPIPCVAVSANALPAEVRRARDAGFADYLTKPFEVDHVLALVDRLRG